MRILLVDDNASVRRGIRSLIAERSDWSVCGEAADGLEAIEKTKRSAPDLILMDISMPRMDGLEATRVIRQVCPDTRVIIVSQNDPTIIQRKAAECGASAWIGKSTLSLDLLPCIERMSRETHALPSNGASGCEREKIAATKHECINPAFPEDREPAFESELEIAKLLQAVSAQLVVAGDAQVLHDKIMDAAVGIMRSDFASMQTLDERRGELHLIASRGFTAEAQRLWEWVREDTGSSCSIAMRQGRRLLVSDVAQSKLMPAESRAAYLRAGICAAQSTPLVSRDGRLLGMISTHWREPHQPSEHDLRLFDILARQAADLMERKQAEDLLRKSERWFAAQKDALQAAMNGVPLHESLGHLVQTAVKQIEGEAQCAFYLANAEGSELHHVVGMSDEYARCVDGFKVSPESVACGLVVATGRASITPDVREDPRWKPWLWMAEQFGYRSCWSFPVETVTEKMVGTFAVYFKEPRKPTSHELTIAGAVTHVAAIIISRNQESEQRAAAESELRESEERFRTFTNTIFDAVYRMSPDWSEMRHFDGREFLADTKEPSRTWLDTYIPPDDQPHVLAAIQNAIAARDVFELEHRVLRADGTLGWTHSRAIPVLNDRGEIIEWFGAAADVTERKRGEQELRTLTENLEMQVRERTRDLEQRNSEILAQSEQLRELSAHLFRSQDEERRRFARELHDSAGQILTVLAIEQSRLAAQLNRSMPDLARQMDEIRAVTDQLTRDIRTTSYLLHPPMLDEGGLPNALQWYIDGLTARSAIQIELKVSEDFGRLKPHAEVALFRVIQEALTNVHRHSGSETATIRMTRNIDSVSVEIEDHGHGMSPERLKEVQSCGGGVGVRGMRERIHQLGGAMRIESTSRGTKVSVKLPAQEIEIPPEAVPGQLEAVQSVDPVRVASSD